MDKKIPVIGTHLRVSGNFMRINQRRFMAMPIPEAAFLSVKDWWIYLELSKCWVQRACAVYDDRF